MIFPGVLNLGLSREIKRTRATPLTEPAWLESFERSRKSFGLENLTYQYYTYPETNPGGTVWVLNRRRAVLLVSEGFLKSADESQVGLLMGYVNYKNFNQFRYSLQRKSIRMFFSMLKGEAKNYRFWVISFFLYPFERLFGVARV